MTPRQILALMVPCYRAIDTVDPRFGAVVTAHGRRFSTLLTVNK